MEIEITQVQQRLLASPLPLYFGGSFNPFHCGHRAIVASLRKNFPSCPVILLPNRVSPLKQGQTDETPRLRWPSKTQKMALLQAVLQDLRCYLQIPLESPLLTLELCELQRLGPSYTADTLQLLLEPKHKPRQLPEPKLAAKLASKCCLLALGWDSFCSLEHWKNWTYLLDTCIFVVFRRQLLNTGLPNSQTEWAPAPQILETTEYLLLDLDQSYSSTAIRQFLAQPSSPTNKSECERLRQLEELLGPRQLAYIWQEGLYQEIESLKPNYL